MNFERRIVASKTEAESLQQRIDRLALARLIELERSMKADGYNLRTGIEIEFHINNRFSPVYGALDLTKIDAALAGSPYIEAVKSSGLHTLLPATVADHYTQQYEITLGSQTRQGRERPPSTLVRAADKAMALTQQQLAAHVMPYYRGQSLQVDYHPHPPGALYPADTQISVSVRDANGQAVLRSGKPVLERSTNALLQLQHDAFECFTPLRGRAQSLPGATRHLKHSERLPYYRHRDYSVHSIPDAQGNIRMENRMIAADSSPALPMLLTVGAVWLGLQAEKDIPREIPDVFPRSHADALTRMRHSDLLREVLGPELYAACIEQQQARVSGSRVQY